MTLSNRTKAFDTVFTRTAKGILKPIVQQEIKPNRNPIWEFPRYTK